MAALVVVLGQATAEVEIPAFTAYSSPDPNRGMNRSREGAITSWDSKSKLSWYGHIAKKGELELFLKTLGEVEKGVTAS